MDILPPIIRKCVFRMILKSVGKGVFIDYHTYIRYAKRVSVGDGTTVNRGCRILASHYYKDVEITIGKHCAVAPEVCFLASQHDYHDLTLPDTAASIHVGDYVWIGARSVILPGITIGEGAIIGANSVVTHDIPPYTVAVGVPARVIKERVLDEKSRGTS
ncbi:MAG: hypothetical protein IK133_04375 [Clostridia bacterium]|nr:hypothetical protein [Clostridia bacterium]MBR5383037.1 hypothetical protein [Clostridia bacterium]